MVALTSARIGHVKFCIFENLGRKMTSRMATTAEIPIPPALVNEAKLYFQCKIKELQAW